MHQARMIKQVVAFRYLEIFELVFLFGKGQRTRFGFRDSVAHFLIR